MRPETPKRPPNAPLETARRDHSPGHRLLLLPAAALVLLALTAALSGCARATGSAVTQITVAGSTSVTPFAEGLAEEFMRQHPGLEVNIQGIGSSAGIQATETGAADIGMSSRELKSDEEDRFQPVTIALDAMAVIVHPSNPVRNLTVAQVRDIFSGKTASWREFGGDDSPITVVNREAGSGARGAFEELVMGKKGPPLSYRSIRQGSQGAVRAVVEADPRAVGYISSGVLVPGVRALNIEGVEPTPENAVAGRYKLVRPFLFVLLRGATPSDLGKQYIAYILSNPGQAQLEKAGLIASPQRELPWKN